MPKAQRHDRAVALCCDQRFLPFALFVIRQIIHHNADRTFDIVIASPEALDIPAWAAGLDLTVHRCGPLPDAAGVISYHGNTITLQRLMLPRELGDRYRRILFLDCDIFVEGGDLSRLLDAEIGSHPLAAVLDAPYFTNAGFHAEEFRRIGWQAHRYANAGVQLVDTRAFVEQGVEERSFDAARNHREAIVYSDQSMLNIALRGRFAQLSPVWNWQVSATLPLMAQTFPVFIRHFIGRLKPNSHSGRRLDSRFNLAYREFMSRFAPEMLPALAPAPKTRPLDLKELAHMALNHANARQATDSFLARHPDPYLAL
jgi:lipopolysaccharide biosynthesis glycosyltransferase